MKVVYLIIIAIIVLILLAVRYQYNERKTGLPAGTVKICSPSNPDNCQFVNEKIVNAVHQSALAIANADEAETFPVETLGDYESTYDFSQSDLNAICLSVAQKLKVDLASQKAPSFESIQAVILFLHAHQSDH